MSTSVGLAHDTGWDQILSNLCCISKESRIKRTIWIEVWENRIKHTRTEQMEEAVAVWPAWKVHFTAFKSQTHTHLHNSQGIIKSKTIFRILEQSVFGEFLVSQTEFLFTLFENCFSSSILYFLLCLSSLFCYQIPWLFSKFVLLWKQTGDINSATSIWNATSEHMTQKLVFKWSVSVCC